MMAVNRVESSLSRCAAMLANLRRIFHAYSRVKRVGPTCGSRLSNTNATRKVLTASWLPYHFCSSQQSHNAICYHHRSGSVSLMLKLEGVSGRYANRSPSFFLQCIRRSRWTGSCYIHTKRSLPSHRPRVNQRIDGSRCWLANCT